MGNHHSERHTTEKDPTTYRKLVVQEMTRDFRAAVSVETVNLCKPKDGEICVKNRYVGVSESDFDTTKVRHWYLHHPLPHDIGYEGVGEVVKLGRGVKNLKVGEAVAYLKNSYSSHNERAFAEYSCIPANSAFAVPEAKPEYLVLLVSGLTAVIGLDKNACIKNGETVLITAAAEDIGHIAVQWAKTADCHVIGTCSSADKEKVLKELGCDRVINYKEENLEEVLSKEYPKGIDVIFETIGGKVMETCFKSLSVKGRLIMVGGLDKCKYEQIKAIPDSELSSFPEKMLLPSSAIKTFILLDYRGSFHTYFKYLLENVESGKIRAICDFGKDEEFLGMEGIIKGVEHRHSGKSIGKVVVKIY